MPVRRNLIAVAVLTLTGATAAGGAAYAAGGEPPSGAPTAKCVPAKVVADSVKDQDGQQRLEAAAKALGVSTQKLTDAFVATKQWVGTAGTKPTPETFAGHVASLLGKDAATVQQALVTAGMLGDGPSTVRVVVKETDAQQDQHFAAAAEELEISTQKLTDALVATKQWVGTTTDKLTGDAFTAHVASVLGLDAAKVAHALDVNGVFRVGPVIKAGAPAGNTAPAGKAGPTGGPVCSVPDKADKVQSQEITTVAKTLGVTDAKLTDALTAAKQSLGASGEKPTPEAFAARVASTLGLSADKVLHALESAGMVGTDGRQKVEMNK